MESQTAHYSKPGDNSTKVRAVPIKVFNHTYHQSRNENQYSRLSMFGTYNARGERKRKKKKNLLNLKGIESQPPMYNFS